MDTKTISSGVFMAYQGLIGVEFARINESWVLELQIGVSMAGITTESARVTCDHMSDSMSCRNMIEVLDQQETTSTYPFGLNFHFLSLSTGPTPIQAPSFASSTFLSF